MNSIFSQRALAAREMPQEPKNEMPPRSVESGHSCKPQKGSGIELTSVDAPVNQAAKSRPRRKISMGGAKEETAMAVIGPMPGNRRALRHTVGVISEREGTPPWKLQQLD